MVNINHDQLELRPEYIDMHKEKQNTIIRVGIADPCNQSTQPEAISQPFIRKPVSRPPLRPERNHTDEKPFERHSSKVFFQTSRNKVLAVKKLFFLFGHKKYHKIIITSTMILWY